MRFSGLRPLPFFCNVEDVEKEDAVDLGSEDWDGVMRAESAVCGFNDGRSGIWKVRASADRIEE